MNNVHIGGDRINKAVTSRAQLLAAAKELAFQDSLSSVSIRAVAKRCGVAVGSIYNYFPTKADLIAAVIEDFWRQAASNALCPPQKGELFTAYVGRLYSALRSSLAEFQSGWLEQVTALGTAERQKGRALEAQYFSQLQQGLIAALEQDMLARRNGPAADAAQLASFVFSNMLLLLRTQGPDCTYLQQILSVLLYS